MKINTNKLKLNIIISLIFIACIGGILFFSKSLAVYLSSGNSYADVELAFSLINVEELKQDIKLDPIEPGSLNNEFEFTVSNFKEDKLIDVNMEYSIKIITTTNLPLTYTLYDESGNEIALKSEYETDESGTIFYIIKTDKYNFDYKNKKTNYFKLVYSLDSKYNDSSYQDIIELMTIEIDAKQV